MILQLDALEQRLVGCLIEKEITTPDQYPLSLNALLNACNQKSNREPLLQLDEPTVQHGVDTLARRHLVVEKSGFGSRVPKYQHRFCNSEFGTLKFTAQELAIVCELLLRGPQTAGELRPRAGRMATFADAEEVEQVLNTLAARADGPFVVRLAREPGRRDARYAHCFADPPTATAAVTSAASVNQNVLSAPAPAGGPALHPASSIAQIELRVAALEAALVQIKAALPPHS